jgi:hypothetical protein
VTLRALQVLLLFAALLGLAGEATAVAAVQPIAAPPAAASPMSDDCMAMMEKSKDSRSAPCDGTFKCMLAMGCLSLTATAEFGSAEVAAQRPVTEEYWPAVAILRGASFAPEPDPPTAFV